jgi:hypothetical protein
MHIYTQPCTHAHARTGVHGRRKMAKHKAASSADAEVDRECPVPAQMWQGMSPVVAHRRIARCKAAAPTRLAAHPCGT